MPKLNETNVNLMIQVRQAFEDFNSALQNIDPRLWSDDITIMGTGGEDDKLCRVFYDDGAVFIDPLGKELI